MTRPELDESETGYRSGTATLTTRRFLRAMSFHYPEALAAVRDDSGAYHIREDGSPAYSQRFQDAAGFYEGLASVRGARGYVHIRPDATLAHDRRFRWLGNFQGGHCVALGPNGFHHVRSDGADSYPQRYSYVGDFRYGVAVARSGARAFHIRTDGTLLHGRRFVDAEPFHKGAAVVCDEDGYFHVDRRGDALHTHRFARAEPFYNGYALCLTHAGEWVRLRASGAFSPIRHGCEALGASDVRAALGRGVRVALLVRHAERHEIDPSDPSWGDHVLVTDRGVAQATRLGTRLAGPWSTGLYASTVERCVQTAYAVGAGLGLTDPRVSRNDELACRTYFDASRDHEPLMRRDYHELLTRYLGDGVAPGMRRIDEGSDALLARIHADMDSADLTVHVSHDLACAVLADHLGLKGATPDDWCDYLEGVCILRSAEQITYHRFRGLEDHE
ncbi:MAG: histidine phosphatase family protein [Sandaracinaceae bacterium]|nr:histidine phosphatase family protein [Sandaracinaceae bacterium]